MRVSKRTIGPDEASKLLEKMPVNRNLSQATVDQYAADMRTGKWREVGDPIRISKAGNVLDGQHRLWAVIEAKKPQEFIFIFDLPEDAIYSIDVGLPRRVPAVLQMKGYHNTARTCAMARVVDTLEHGNTKLKRSVDMIRAILKAHPGIEQVVSLPGANGKGPLRTSGVLAAFAILCEKEPNVGPQMLDAFMSGTNMTHGDALLTLRNFLINNPNTGGKGSDAAIVVARRCLAAFSYYLNGEPYLRSLDSEEGMRHFFGGRRAA